jgi:hypothetical protein
MVAAACLQHLQTQQWVVRHNLCRVWDVGVSVGDYYSARSSIPVSATTVDGGCGKVHIVMPGV